MAKIPVPKPAKGSFNQHRPVSDLLRSQLKHMREVERQLPYQQRTGRNIEEIKTEGEAAEYIARITGRLHVRGKITVPRSAPGSYNKHRPISDLIKSQIQHFREVEMAWPEAERTGVDIRDIKTEQNAAEYIRQVTARLHGDASKAGARPAGEKAAARSNPASGGQSKTTKRATSPKGPGARKG